VTLTVTQNVISEGIGISSVLVTLNVFSVNGVLGDQISVLVLHGLDTRRQDDERQR